MPPSSEPDQADLSAVLDRLVDAWNRGDAQAFASLFAPEADYVTGDGDWVRGRAAIGRLVEGAPAAPASITGPLSIRSHGDAATAIFQWSAQREGTAASGVASVVFTRHGTRWLIDRLHNTDRREPPA